MPFAKSPRVAMGRGRRERPNDVDATGDEQADARGGGGEYGVSGQQLTFQNDPACAR